MSLRDKFVRTTGKFTDIIPIAVVETLVLVFVAAIVASVLFSVIGIPGIPRELFSDPEAAAEQVPAYVSCAAEYLTFVGFWVVFLLAIVIPPSNRRMLRKLVPGWGGNTFKSILFGLLAGFVLNATCVVISIFTKDVALSFDHFEPLPLLIIFGAVFVQSSAEELVTRLFLYQKLRRRYKSPIVAMVVSALFFMALHLANPGINTAAIIQIVSIGVLFTVLVHYYDALGACMMIHTTWNFTQNIIFGLPNSGIVSQYSIFKLEAASSGPFFDPAFGVEGSYGASALIIASIIVLVVIAKAQHRKPDDLWGDGEAYVEEYTEYVPKHAAK